MRLIQASATALTLVENTLDVVVTNGVLRVCSSPRGRNQALARAVLDPHCSSETRCKLFLPYKQVGRHSLPVTRGVV